MSRKFYSKRAQVRHLKSRFRRKIRKRRAKDRIKRGHAKFMQDIRASNPKEKVYKDPIYKFHQRTKLAPKPYYSDNLQYFIKKQIAFSSNEKPFSDGPVKVPKIFSLIENYAETTNFLRRLLISLQKQYPKHIIFDYDECYQIDVGASICMDILLSDFINYYDELQSGRHTVRIAEIKPINFDRPEIHKVLFSIGAFKNIKGVEIEFPDIISFPLRYAITSNPNLSKHREVDITRTVDYIIRCVKETGRSITAKAETNLYEVIGEVIINAEEHSSTRKRYLIGYFQSSTKGNNAYGIFNLAILNFGQTIYETFKDPKCKNRAAVLQMESLSRNFTKRNVFRKAEFEEETLWTLYALQEGITRKADWKRGNGSIRFIESFFELKGNDVCDNISKMVITSGRTRIIFDGAYEIVEKPRGREGKLFKMMTFNDAANIEELPDPKYVKYEQNYFPGTLISVKIRIDTGLTNEINNGS